MTRWLVKASVICIVMAMSNVNALACNTKIIEITDWLIRGKRPTERELFFQLTSNSERGMRSVDASLIVEDRNGNMFLSSFINRNIMIKSRGVFIMVDKLQADEAIDHMQKSDLKAYVCTRSVVFEDGQIENYD